MSIQELRRMLEILQIRLCSAQNSLNHHYTWTHDCSKHPALPIADRLALRCNPLPEDGTASQPLGRGCPIKVLPSPAFCQDSSKLITVQLQRRRRERWIKELPFFDKYTSSCSLKLPPRQMKPKGCFVQRMKVVTVQYRYSSFPWDLFRKCTAIAKKFLQPYLFAAGISGRAGVGQEVLFGRALRRLLLWSVHCVAINWNWEMLDFTLY